MATIRSRRNGFQVNYTVKGRRHRRQFATRDEAEEFVVAALDAPAAGPVTLAGLLARHRQRPTGRSGEEIADSTRVLEMECSRPLLRVLGEHVAVEGLAQVDIDKYRRARNQEGVAPGTVAKELRVLKAALRWAQARDVIKAMPVELSRLSSTRRDRDPTTLEDEEVEALLDAAAPHARLVLALCRWAGLRRGEALALQHRDIDLDGAGVIHVRAKKLEDGTLWRPKTRARRSVPISGRLRVELEKLLPAGDAPEIQVVRYRGRAIADVADAVLGAYRRAGIDPPQGCHVLRRTWATRLLAAGVSPEIVRRLGGWSNLSVILESYAGAIPMDVLAGEIEKASSSSSS